MSDDDFKNSKNEHSNNENEESIEHTSRRSFLKKTGIATGGVVGGALLGGLIGNPFRTEDEETTAPPKVDYTEARQFFKRKEDFEVLATATERIFPEEETGPGAIELGVPYYIDRQLAGVWGINGKEYRDGPFYEGEPNQGYQSRLNRQEIFQIGIKGIQDHSQKEYDEIFPDIEEAQQDEILTALENDEIKLIGLHSSLFFELLRTATLEGVYADPSYGGNKNMAGWKMKEFTGAQLSFMDQIDNPNFLKVEPKALNDYQ